MVKKRVIRWS